MDGLGAAPCSDAAALGSAPATPRVAPALAALLGLALPSPRLLSAPRTSAPCLPSPRRGDPIYPSICTSSHRELHPSAAPLSPVLAQGTGDRQQGSAGSQGDKTAGSHSPTSHDLAQLPEMETGRVPPLGDISAGLCWWQRNEPRIYGPGRAWVETGVGWGTEDKSGVG